MGQRSARCIAEHAVLVATTAVVVIVMFFCPSLDSGNSSKHMEQSVEIAHIAAVLQRRSSMIKNYIVVVKDVAVI